MSPSQIYVFGDSMSVDVCGEEVNWALKVMDEVSRKTKPGKPLAEIIREFRDCKRG